MNEKALVQVNEEVNALISISAVDLSQSVEDLYKEMSDASNSILECNNIAQLNEAISQLNGLNKHLGELKTAPITKFPIISSIQKALRKSEKAVNNMILRRQSIKTILEEKRATYEVKRDALMVDIEKIREYGKEASKTTKKIEGAIARLKNEIQILENELESNPNLEADISKQIQYGINARRSVLADLSGNKVLNETSEITLATQIDEREALFLKMGSIRPSLDALLSQQLVALITQAPVRAAINEINESVNTIRELAKESSQMTKEDAVMTAKIVGDPIIDSETLNTVTNNICSMIDEVKKEAGKILTNQQNVIKTAEESSRKLRGKLTAIKQIQ